MGGAAVSGVHRGPRRDPLATGLAGFGCIIIIAGLLLAAVSCASGI